MVFDLLKKLADFWLWVCVAIGALSGIGALVGRISRREVRREEARRKRLGYDLTAPPEKRAPTPRRLWRHGPILRARQQSDER